MSCKAITVMLGSPPVFLAFVNITMFNVHYLSGPESELLTTEVSCGFSFLTDVCGGFNYPPGCGAVIKAIPTSGPGK